MEPDGWDQAEPLALLIIPSVPCNMSLPTFTVNIHCRFVELSLSTKALFGSEVNEL